MREGARPRPGAVASGPAGVKAAVYRLVRRIPPGRVLTYGEIAARVGRPGGARAVGQAMRVCPSDLPWHRVVNARGGISPRARQSGMVTQRIRLEQEGVAFRAGRVVLTRHRWLDGRPSRSAEGTRARSPSPGAPPGRVARVARARAWP